MASRSKGAIIAVIVDEFHECQVLVPQKGVYSRHGRRILKVVKLSPSDCDEEYMRSYRELMKSVNHFSAFVDEVARLAFNLGKEMGIKESKKKKK